MKKQPEDILAGVHSVLEALRAGRREFFEVYIAREGASSERLAPIKTLAKQNGISIKEIPAGRLTSKTGVDLHQGVGARVSRFPVDGLTALTESKHALRFLLIADGLQDPQNLGALLRSALCAGVEAVIIPKNRAAPPTPTVSRASAGALEHMRLLRVTNITDTIRTLKQAGLWVIGADVRAEASLFSVDLTVPLALVIGSEDKGIRPLVKKHCDLLVRIPQDGPLGSLNASAAGAVMMYEVFRQRTSQKKTY